MPGEYSANLHHSVQLYNSESENSVITVQSTNNNNMEMFVKIIQNLSTDSEEDEEKQTAVCTEEEIILAEFCFVFI